MLRWNGPTQDVGRASARLPVAGLPPEAVVEDGWQGLGRKC